MRVAVGKIATSLAIFATYATLTSGALPNTVAVDFASQHFRRRGVTQVTSLLCRDGDNLSLHKQLSASGIRMSFIDAQNSDKRIVVSQLSAKYLKVGILLDLKCDGSYDVLRTAHEHDLFIQSKSPSVWLLLLENHIPQESIARNVRRYQPQASDPVQYLLEPYHDTNNSNLLIEINRRFNSEFITKRRKTPEARQRLTNATGIDAILPLHMLLDSQVTLAVPAAGNTTLVYELYRVFKVTKESEAESVKSGEVFAVGDEVSIADFVAPERKSLNGALLRGVTAIYNLEHFTRLDDLSTRDTDAWAKMSYSITRLLEEDLNFSTIIRFFDDYGWLKNNSFTALMGHLERRKADLSAASLLFRSDRFRVLDYLDSPFRLQTGILFREPSLSSVSNIFLLPFSQFVWASTAAVIVLMVAAFKFEAVAGIRYKWLEKSPDLSEIVFFVLSTVGQQGYHWTPISTTGRLMFFLLLFTCLALFTAYSAKIVALLQSFSSSILSVKDLTSSSFEVGIQANFPFFDVAFKEAVPVHDVIRDFYNKKIVKSGTNVYFEPKDGIEKMRRGLFAYEVELTVGYKLISGTYEEIDKCGLKEIEVFPKPYLGIILQKNSSLRETFTRRLRWFSEIGLIRRAWKLWIPQKPKCEAERIGFISVGFTEFYPVTMIFVYGFAAAMSILLAENIYRRLLPKSEI